MNGLFFTYDTLTTKTTKKSGKYLSHYNDTWVISKEPERKINAVAGAADEWECLFDLQNNNWIPVPKKTLSNVTGNSDIVDHNVLGSFVDYVARYPSANNQDQRYYYRDRNIDGVFNTADYSVPYTGKYNESILGSYDTDQTYIKQFNNSVMLYSNLRMIINGNAAVSYSYTTSHQNIGTILVPFGDLLEDFIPNFYREGDKQYIVCKNAMGYIRIIRLGFNINNRIQRIAQYVHRINTVDAVNVIAEREVRITAEHGSLDWNNKFEINNQLTTNELREPTTYHVNSAYNPLFEISGLRSMSMIVSDTTFTLYGFLYNQPVANNLNLNFINCHLLNGSIDVFYDTVQPSKYKYSISNNMRIFNSRFENLSFPLGVIVPFPVGTKWSMHNEVSAIGEMGLGLLATGLVNSNKSLDAYLFSDQVYFGQDSFDLFGIIYVYDGDYIYQGSDRVAMAFGYHFMGCDSNYAYFYNQWDKSVYVFNGSRTLNKILNLSNRSPVKVGRFDGYSGEMIFLTQDEILKSREGVIMNFPYTPADSIIPTKDGAYILLDDGSRLLLSPKTGDTDNFEIETEFIGIDGSTVCDYERIDIRLFSPNKTAISFTIEMQTINQNTKESELKKIEINSNDWSLDGYKTVKLIPQFKKGIGLSLRISSVQEIFIAGIEFTYDLVSRTANNQRSGF